MPITFVGGYLGAGKTTAINELLAVVDRPIAVLVNDVGSVNIDAALIRRRHGDTIELTNGCVCCTSVDEIGAVFDMLRERAVPPDHVVVELSGVAEIQRMLPWGQSAGFMLDGLIVVVAADQLLDDGRPPWLETCLRSQIAAADLIVLTKVDLLGDDDPADARRRLTALAPQTPIIDASRGRVEAGAIGRFLALGGRRPGGPAVLPDAALFDAHRVQTVSPPGGLDVASLRRWLAGLDEMIGERVVRVKGVVASADEGLVLVQVVGRRCEITPLPQPETQQPSELVVVSLP